MNRSEILAYRASVVKKLALELGFYGCGISVAGFLESEAPRLEDWLNTNKQGKMAYMANHFDLRLDPRKLEPGTKTIVSLLYNYFPGHQKTTAAEAPNIARYALGEDYHFVVKRKMREWTAAVQNVLGPCSGRVFVDSAPILEKAWAAKAGLGWIGKNTNLISPKKGSYFFLAEWLVDLEMAPDNPIPDYCGDCTRCIDACPTGAIEPYSVNGSKCISYFTIELKEAIRGVEPSEFKDWMFGCDICQEVCPWNRFAELHQEPAFMPKMDLLQMSREDWKSLSQDAFQKVFSASAVKRTGYSGLMRNIEFLDSEKNEPSQES
jgi:epoxyqueuosine reductase